MASARGLLGIIQLFGSLGLSARPIDVSDSDSGIGIEGTEVLREGKFDSDTGVGVDAGESMPGTIPDTETGVGVDAGEVISATLSSAETGAGVDTEGFSVTAPSDETGVIIARAQYTSSENQYYIIYKAGDGRQITSWWDEGHIEKSK